MFYSDTLISHPETVDLVGNGFADVGICTPANFVDRMPLHCLVQSFYGLGCERIDQQACLIGRASYHPLLLAEAENLNLMMIGTFAFPPMDSIMGKGTPVETLADLAGVKVAAYAQIGDLFSHYGATPVYSSVTDTYTNIDTGVIDASWYYTEVFYKYNIYEIADYLTYGIPISPAQCYMTCNLDSWNALPQDIQDIVLGLMEQDTPAVLQAVYVDEEVLAMQRQTFLDNGVEFCELSEDDRADWTETFAELRPGWLEELGEGADVVAAHILEERDGVLEDWPEGMPPVERPGQDQ